MRTLVLLLAACGSAPAFEHSRPAPLPNATVLAQTVRVEVRPLPWWTSQGSDDKFILELPAPDSTTPGRDIGAIRSGDIALDAGAVADIRCAWLIVPVGDLRPCIGTREGAMATVHDTIHRAFDELRASAAAAGANVAADVRCFVEDQRLWCEGTARVVADDHAVEKDAVAPRSDEPPMEVTRFAISGDGSIAVQGGTFLRGTSIALRYRPLEVSFDVIDLIGSAKSLVGIGGTVLTRVALRSRADAIAGGSAAIVAPNGSVNPAFAGRYEGFIGLGYQAQWRWHNVAQPWVQLRVGAARFEGATLPAVGLHLGLATPDRR